MRASALVPFLASASVVAACGGVSDTPSFDGTTCGNGTVFDEKANQCVPTGPDAGGDSGGGAGTSGTGASGGAGGTPFDASPDAPSDSDATDAESDAGKSDAGDADPDGPPGCVPPDAYGNVMVTLRVQLTVSNVPATFYNGLSGGWTAVPVTTVKAELQSYTAPALRKVNAKLADGAWLVEGGPSLSVPATAIEAWFGCQKAPPVTQVTSSGPMAGYTVGFAKMQGDSGPNLWFCADKAGCGFQLAP